MEQLALFPLERAKREIRLCDELNALHGLVLTDGDILELTQLRAKALKAAGRVEFGGGILPKLIRAFCDSPYVDRENYVSVLAELQDAFYYFKSDSGDRFSDDDLIEFMKTLFNGRAEGSVELLATISLEELCYWARNDGLVPNTGEEDWL